MYHLFLFRKLNKTSIFNKAYGSIQIKECQNSYTLIECIGMVLIVSRGSGAMGSGGTFRLHSHEL